MLRDDVGRLTKFHGGLVFAFRGDDLCAPLALRLCFFGHGALHVVGHLDVFDLDRGDLRAPGFGVPIDDVLDLLVDAGRVRQ